MMKQQPEQDKKPSFRIDEDGSVWGTPETAVAYGRYIGLTDEQIAEFLKQCGVTVPAILSA